MLRLGGMSPRTLLLLLLIFSTGCFPPPQREYPEPDSGRTEEPGDAGWPGADGGVTYTQDVAPILSRQCVSCHQPGAVAPFSLLTYEDAVTHAAGMRVATANRSMPPFNPDNSGACQTFLDARWLTTREIATLDAWVSGGTPRGPSMGASLPPAPPPLMPADAVGTMPEPYTPTVSYGASEDYRCFVVDAKISATSFLTAFQVVPGEDRVVHHMGIFQADAQGERDALALDAQDARPGYYCLGGPRVSAKLLFASGPGRTLTTLPEGTGIKLEGGKKLIFQIHYHLSPQALSDQTSLRLKLAPSVAREGLVVGFGTNEINLMPGQRDATAHFESSLWWLLKPATVYGLTPHMHMLGSAFQGSLLHRNGESTCLVDVPRWSFGWQQLAVYSQPLIAYPGDVVKGTCHYNTLSRTLPVRYGETSDDEMCALWFYVVP